MPVERFRDASDMPRPPRPAPDELLRSIARIWELAHVRVPPDVPRGVQRFHTMEEAQEARQRRQRERARRLRNLAT